MVAGSGIAPSHLRCLPACLPHEGVEKEFVVRPYASTSSTHKEFLSCHGQIWRLTLFATRNKSLPARCSQSLANVGNGLRWRNHAEFKTSSPNKIRKTEQKKQNLNKNTCSHQCRQPESQNSQLQAAKQPKLHLISSNQSLSRNILKVGLKDPSMIQYVHNHLIVLFQDH